MLLASGVRHAILCYRLPRTITKYSKLFDLHNLDLRTPAQNKQNLVLDSY